MAASEENLCHDSRVEPDFDDTLPGRSSGPAMPPNMPTREGFSETRDTPDNSPENTGDTVVGDTDDTIVGVQVRLDPAETGPLDGAVVRDDGVSQYGVRLDAHGPIVSLERPVYVGRRPSTPRIRNGELPTLLSVDSPAKIVSGTHLEIRQIGSSVVVTDLRSTNGSRVSVPGRESRTLRGGEAMVVTPGTSVDIGDGNILEVLPLTRLHHTEG